MAKELSILMVEDVAADAAAIERELRAESVRFKARRVETREDFLHQLKHSTPDVVLSDFTLPSFDALEALKLLKMSHPEVPFILVTGTRSEEVAVECLRQGADDYILKASLKRLPSSIHNALQKKAAEREMALAQTDLKSSEEQFRMIAENSHDLISLLDLEGNFLYASRSFGNGLGRAAEDLAGTDFFALVHEEDRPALRRIWEEARDGRQGRTAEFRARHRDGSWRILESSCNWFFDDRKKPQRSVVISRDITKRKQAEEALRGLPRLIRDAQEAERRRVARELHDGIMQILSSVKFRFQSVEDRLAKLDAEGHLEAAKASGLLEKAIREIRHISRNLRPTELDDLGLAAAVRSLCTDFAERTGLDVRLDIATFADPISGECELNVYRIIQEALNNIEKHAAARHVNVRLEQMGPLLHVRIRDDGRGFDPDSLRQSKNGAAGMGMMDIRERATMAGGSCVWNAKPGQGTELQLQVVLATPAEPRQDDRDKRKKRKDQTAARG